MKKYKQIKKVHYVYIFRKKHDPENICKQNYNKIIEELEKQELLEEENYNYPLNNQIYDFINYSIEDLAKKIINKNYNIYYNQFS